MIFRSGEKPLELRGEYGNLVLAKQFSQQRMVSNRVLKSVLNQELTACQEYTPDQSNEPTVGPPRWGPHPCHYFGCLISHQL